MKYQVLFSLKNNEKAFINIVCCSLIGALRVNFQGKRELWIYQSRYGEHQMQILVYFYDPKLGQLPWRSSNKLPQHMLWKHIYLATRRFFFLFQNDLILLNQ